MLCTKFDMKKVLPDDIMRKTAKEVSLMKYIYHKIRSLRDVAADHQVVFECDMLPQLQKTARGCG